MDDDERKFVYELGDFHALPTWGVMPQSNAMLAKAKDGGLKLPGMSYGFDRILHGEQYTEVRGPLPKSAKLKHIFKFKQAYDKDPHAVVVFGVSTVDEHGEELVYNEMTSFVRGAGGWGGERGPSADINVPPAREPDAIVEEATDANQTLLYRLSGDWNPLHADPAFAKAFGYDKPILHGLCTFGHVGRHVVKAMLGNDPARFKGIKVRFAEPVFPGETLVTKMWKEAGNRVIVETSVKERGKVVIKNAVVEFYDEIPVRKPKAASQDTDATAAVQPDKVIPQDVFAVIADHVAGHPELAAKVDTAFQFKLNNPESHWVLDLKTGADAVREGVADKADCTIELDADLLHTVVTAPLADVQKLFFGGQMKVGGDVMASNKLSELSVIDPDQYDKAKARRLAANVT